MGIATYRERSAATCHGERSAAIKFRWIAAVALFLLSVVSTATAKYGGGSGTAQDPYQIATAADLILLGETPADYGYGKHIIMTADIDLDPKLPGRKVFDKAVIAGSSGAWFTGVFDGKGHTISHLTVKGTSYLGLFGSLASGAQVRGLGVVDVNVTGSGGHAGGLVGDNGGRVTDCYSTGAVSGTYLVGGLVGYNYGALTDCYSTGAVSGKEYVGGLVGHNSAYNSVVVTQCYSTGAVSGNEYVGGLVGGNNGIVSHSYSTGSVTGGGGLVGNNYGTVTQCYSTGAVSSPLGGGLAGQGGSGIVLNSVWDMETSGQSGSAGGVGLTTAEMMDPYMLGLNGFANDPNWVLDAGHDYPRLAWEGTLGQMIPEPAIDWLEGSGTPEAPYRIDTPEQLLLLGRAGAICDRHFVLGADIDLDPKLPGRHVFAQPVIPTLAGVFDGSGHAISHLTIKGGGRLGLFGRLGSRAEVRDLAVVNVNVAGSSGSVGALAGGNDGTVIRCYSAGAISGGSDVGGLVGENSGAVIDCRSNGKVGGSYHVGGLVGSNGQFGGAGGTVIRCYSTGAISGGSDVGGLVGLNYGTVGECYSTGAATASGDYVGGLVGYHHGSLIYCYSTGAATTSGDYVGGLVGCHQCEGDTGWQTSGDVIQCYSTGTVTGRDRVGGLLPGGSGTMTDCFWDIQTSGQAKSGGGTGKTTSEMQDIRTYQEAGWDFAPAIDDGDRQIWQMPAGGGYPVLAVFNGYTPARLEGSGTAQEPYLIHDALELGAIVHYSPNAHYRLMAPIDLSGIRWDLAVIPWFAGTFDGNGHTISHLTIKGGWCLGLFGQLASGAEVKDLRLVDVNVTGSGNYVGALAGSNKGTVTRCYSTGVVHGLDSVGGLVGSNGSTVNECCSTGAVSGGWDVGGLVGDNEGGVTHCYSTGVVSGPGGLWRGVGGLVGRNEGPVIHCHSDAAVGGDYVGGLVGYNYWRGAVTQSYSNGPVTHTNTGWDSNAGGLVGLNEGAVTLCYSDGVVVSDSGGYVGGLLGWNAGVVTQCYASGAVIAGHRKVFCLVGHNDDSGRVTYCFWDTQTSRQAGSAAGTGKTTAEMQTAKTFLEAGWDFMGETANGTEDIWWILEGKDYPRFVWERGPARLSHPAEGAVDIPQPLVLRWRPGGLALQHDVYFAQDQDTVANATPETLGIYRGRQPPELTTYDLGTLEWAKTYYWRIDEVNEADPNSPWKGHVWSFTPADFTVVSIVDDFESYSHDLAAGMTLCPTWMPGFLNGTRSFFMTVEQEIVHGGRQSMPMDYNVDYNDVRPWYSEVDRTWGTPQDWTIAGADTLTLYFRGKADNARQPLYVVIEDSGGRIAVVVHPDAEAVLATEWRKWHIALGEVRAAGVDVAAVKKMVIGVGERKNPKPSDPGRIYIDDIRLTKRRP